MFEKILEYFEYFSVPILLYYGYISAFGDIKTGKIPNRVIVLGVKIGIAWHVVVLCLAMWVHKTSLFPEGLILIINYLGEVGFNTAIALAISFFMWWVHLWAAGDAKLFSVFALMVPIDFYGRTPVRYFPSFALLFNIFIVALFVVVVDLIYKLAVRFLEGRRSGEIRGFIDKYINRPAVREYLSTRWKPGLRLLLGLVFSFLVTSLARKYIGVAFEKLFPWKFSISLQAANVNESIIFLLFFLLFRPLSRLYQNLVFYYVTICSIFGYVLFSIVFHGSFAIITEVARFGGLSILLIVFRKFYEFYSERINVRTIPLAELRPHTILSRKTVQSIQTADKEFFNKHFEIIFADGLTEEQFTALGEWNKFDSIEISGTIPFAPCILGGVVVTIIFKGIIFVFLIGG